MACAFALCARLHGRLHPLQTEIPQRIRPNFAPNILHIHAVANQLLIRGHINAHKTGVAHRRRRDTHMHLGRARLAQQGNNRPNRVAPHNRIIHQHHPLATQIVGQGVVLEPHPLAAHLVHRLDKGTADVPIFGQPLVKRNAQLLPKTDGGWVSRIGHTHHKIRLHRRLFGQLPPHPLAHLMDNLPLKFGVGAGKVDILEDAQRLFFGGRTHDGSDPVFIEANDFARLDFAHKLGSHC